MGERNSNAGNGGSFVFSDGGLRSFVFSDGGLLEGDNVGGGAFVVNGPEQEVVYGVGTVATVGDGEVAGIARGLARTSRNGNKNGNGGKVLIVADSKAVISHRGCEEGQQDSESVIPSLPGLRFLDTLSFRVRF